MRGTYLPHLVLQLLHLRLRRARGLAQPLLQVSDRLLPHALPRAGLRQCLLGLGKLLLIRGLQQVTVCCC